MNLQMSKITNLHFAHVSKRVVIKDIVSHSLLQTRVSWEKFLSPFGGDYTSNMGDQPPEAVYLVDHY